jgi:hypothetical protein
MRLRASVALLLLLALPAGAQEPVETGFDVRRDGLPFANLGDFRSPDGNCLGMALLAIDNFRRRTAGAGPAENEPQARASAAIAHRLADERDVGRGDDRRSENLSGAAEDPTPILQALERLRATGQPEVLAMRGPDGTGHAVVLHGFVDGRLQLYDPNFPGETVTWEFDGEEGLGAYSKLNEDAFYGTIELVSSTPLQQFKTSQDLPWLREACAGDGAACTSQFPALESLTTKTRARDGKTRIQGRLTVPAGGQPGDAVFPDRVWVHVDGKPVTLAFLDPDWRFDVKLPREAYAPGQSLRLVAVTKDGAFAGTHDLAARPPSNRDTPPPPSADTAGLSGVLQGTVR